MMTDKVGFWATRDNAPICFEAVMSKQWKRPTRVEIARIRAECKEWGIGEERAEKLIVAARRSPEEAERHAKEEMAKWDADDGKQPGRTPEEQRAWYEEFCGRNPPRKLPAESAVYLPGWIHDYKKRRPFAEKPWFWIEPHNDSSAAWDGRCFVNGGWEEVEPQPRKYHEAWELAFLYRSAGECLDAAVRISAETGTECEVHAYPDEAYYPPWEVSSGVILDLMRLTWWVRLLVKCANSHYNAGLDPLTPIPDWTMRGYLPRGTVYPANCLCFWYPDCTSQFWDRLQLDFAPPTYLEIFARRGDELSKE
jgi:hypothetical protein